MKKIAFIYCLLLGTIVVIACENGSAVSRTTVISSDKKATIVVPVPKIKDKNAKLNVAKIDIPFLVHLIDAKINRLRKKKRLRSLKVDAILIKAAADQNNYNFKLGDIVHEQPNKKKKTMKERVIFYGGDHFVVGENTQYVSFSKRITNGKTTLILPTYEELANRLVNNWINSRTHYTNLIEKRFNRLGTAVYYDAKTTRVYATQVYGGK